MVEPFEFLLHHPVETGPLLILEGPEFQSFQIQFERGNRRLELVRHAVDEIGLPLIQADFFDNQHQIKRQPRQDCGKDHYAGEQSAPPRDLRQQDNPENHQRNVEHHQHHAERDRQMQCPARAEGGDQR